MCASPVSAACAECLGMHLWVSCASLRWESCSISIKTAGQRSGPLKRRPEGVQCKVPLTGLLQQRGQQPAAGVAARRSCCTNFESSTVMIALESLCHSPQATKQLTRIMPNCVALTPPAAEPALAAWKKMLEGDTATLRERENRAMLAKTLAKCVLSRLVT